MVVINTLQKSSLCLAVAVNTIKKSGFDYGVGGKLFPGDRTKIRRVLPRDYTVYLKRKCCYLLLYVPVMVPLLKDTL